MLAPFLVMQVPLVPSAMAPDKVNPPAPEPLTLRFWFSVRSGFMVKLGTRPEFATALRFIVGLVPSKVQVLPDVPMVIVLLPDDGPSPSSVSVFRVKLAGSELTVMAPLPQAVLVLLKNWTVVLVPDDGTPPVQLPGLVHAYVPAEFWLKV